MKKSKNDTIYEVFGFSVRSQIQFPELLSLRSNKATIDIDIQIKDLSQLWREYSNSQSGYVINENLVIFRVPDIGIFLIENGRLITVSPLKEINEDVIRLYLLGTCMGAILFQRGIFPLHGSAVSINGVAYGIIGDSGAGKSTLATAFLQKGFELLTDDIIGVYLSEEKVPMVIPSYPQQKLWQNSLDAFGIHNKDFKSIHQRVTKFAIPVNKQFSSKPLPLGGLFELNINKTEELEFNKIEGLSRLQTLLIHTYRNLLIQNMGLVNWHFSLSTNISNQIDMYRIRRPKNTFTANELVSLILNQTNKESIKC